MPKVSIILPTYNGSKWIHKSISSILEQSFTDWELLVLDDGSTDETKEVVLSFTNSDSRILYIKNELNIGLQKTLNKGIKMARGQYIARIDDDDVWCDKHKLEDQISFLKSNVDYVLVGTGVIVTDEYHHEIFSYLNPEDDKSIRNIFLKRNPFVHSSVVFRKDIALRVGLYSEDLKDRHIEDYDLWLRIAKIGKVHNLQKHCVIFMSRGGSVTGKNRVSQFKKSIRLVDKNKNSYPKYWQSITFAYLRIIGHGIIKLLPKALQNKIFKMYKNN